MKRSKQQREAEEIALYLKQVRRPTQKGLEPNDRAYDRETERKLQKMSPLVLDAILRREED